MKPYGRVDVISPPIFLLLAPGDVGWSA